MAKTGTYPADKVSKLIDDALDRLKERSTPDHPAAKLAADLGQASSDYDLEDDVRDMIGHVIFALDQIAEQAQTK